MILGIIRWALSKIRTASEPIKVEWCLRCGHLWTEHFRGHLTCLYSTPEEVWACACEGQEEPR